jgi:hypothetical protein
MLIEALADGMRLIAKGDTDSLMALNSRLHGSIVEPSGKRDQPRQPMPTREYRHAPAMADVARERVGAAADARRRPR